MPTLSIDNGLVSYEWFGNGRPVVLLHTWIGSRRYWNPIMQLYSSGHRMYALDLWGFGDSGKDPHRYSIEQQTRLVSQFMDQLGIAKTALIGHGLGAIIAVQIALMYPDRIPRMMLIGLPTAYTIHQQTTEQQHLLSLLTDNRPHPKQITCSDDQQAAYLRKRVAGKTRQTLVTMPDPIRALLLGANVEKLVGIFVERQTDNYDRILAESQKIDPRAIVTPAQEFDPQICLNQVEQILPPVLMIAGSWDPFCDHSDILKARFQRAEGKVMVPLEGLGHFPMFGGEDTTGQLIYSFLRIPDIRSLYPREAPPRRA